MNRSFLMLSGLTKADRHDVTSAVTDAISATGGWVVNHTMFSNIAIAIQFSLPAQKLDDFQHHIIATDVRLDDDSLAKLRAMIKEHAPGSAEISASLNITFIHNEPDLRREVPAVPG